MTPESAITDVIHRYALSLANLAKLGTLHLAVPTINHDAATNPSKSADVIIALAMLVAEYRQDEHLPAYLRKAHAEYNRGERSQWVIDGEREYQRNKKRTTRRRGAA